MTITTDHTAQGPNILLTRVRYWRWRRWLVGVGGSGNVWLQIAKKKKIRKKKN